MENDQVIVIGGGAAGMMAAWAAASNGKKVLLLEKMHQTGLKLRITGKGRCNLTNVSEMRDFLSHCGSEPRFLYPAFKQFFYPELMAFFEQRGVKLVVERGNRVFPAGGKATDIFFALIQALETMSVEIRRNLAVNEILANDQTVKGVRLSDGSTVLANKVILAAGGQSYPQTGSSGDGVHLAQQLGHRIVPCFPSLVGFRVEEAIPDDLVGFTLKNISAAISHVETGKKIASAFGELSFFENSVEGPVVLTLSRKVVRLMQEQKLRISIDFKPSFDEAKWEEKCQRDCLTYAGQPVASLLRHWLPKPVAMYVEKRLPEGLLFKMSHLLNDKDRKHIKFVVKDLAFHIIETNGWERAVVTQGGIELTEIVPQTLESKIVKGLHFAGEVMDLDADTGGYNLQIAFSTGYLAGKSV